ncbi:flavodoxin [Bifidobacterium psychraerophilum]|uniref:flavodoxin n=1 Tax=Bifidobacterium psychraerophilum TaxID=218140 RepID=UPI0039ED66C4
MKQRVIAFVASIALIVVAAVIYYASTGNIGNSSSGTGGAGSPAAPASGTLQPGGKTLVVYFSQPETSRPGNMSTDEDNSTVVIDGSVLGNTQYMAQLIEERSNADMFRVEAATPYPTDHDTLVDQASREQSQGARPAIKGTLPDISQYQTIFVGYPIWWGEMPMIMYTFFDQSDFSGKTIIPFVTHGGSGFAGTVQAIQALEPSAAVSQGGLSISRDDIQDARPEIESWLGQFGY